MEYSDFDVASNNEFKVFVGINGKAVYKMDSLENYTRLMKEEIRLIKCGKQKEVNEYRLP